MSEPDAQTGAFVIPAALLKAYEEASYWVDLPSGRVTLKVGQPLEPTLDLLPGCRLDVVTACNPFSQVLSDADNASRQADLVEVVEAASLAWFPAAGEDADQKWKPEPSLGVLGASDAQLDQLMERFGQYAVVAVISGKTASLRLHPRVAAIQSRGMPIDTPPHSHAKAP